MSDPIQEPAVTPPATPESTVTPPAEPAGTPAGEPAKPGEGTNDQNAQGQSSSSAQSAGSGQVENPIFSAYKQFDEILEKDQEIREAIEGAIQNVAQKRKGTGGQPSAQQASQGGGAPSEVSQLRQEIHFKDYLSEFTGLAQNANIPQDVLQEAFEGTVSEVLKINNNPLDTYNPGLVKQSFEKWLGKWEKLSKGFNTRYAAQKEKDVVPPSGGGAPPVKKPPELTDAQARRDYIASGLKAAFNT